MKRASWGSRIGFVFAVVGSAVGLANIWRFPYITGKYGGAAFIAVYIICLILIGFPVLISELLIGRTTQTSPSGAFKKIGGNNSWGWGGKFTILTGFVVSAFYSAVAGWILGYFIESLRGQITHFQSSDEAITYYQGLIESPFWCVGYHFLFLLFCVAVLYLGVRDGIERWNKVLMPLLFAVLLFLVFKGVSMPGSWEGIKFLLTPDWRFLTPAAILTALGQAFFTLSLGQGTMVTYGSYLQKNGNLVSSSIPIVIMDTCVSLLSAIAVFTIVFSVGMQPDSGPGLIFHTIPWVFSQIPGGYFLAVLFFALVVIAALTSEISALEPSIAYLMDEWKWSRHAAVAVTGFGAFLLGIPVALTFNVLQGVKLFDANILDFISNLASSFMIPLGGFMAVVLVAWIWGVRNALKELKRGSEETFDKHPWFLTYFRICLKYTAPLLMIFVFLNALGLFG